MSDRAGVDMTREQTRALIDLLLENNVPDDLKLVAIPLAEHLDDAQGRLKDGEGLRLEIFEPGD